MRSVPDKAVVAEAFCSPRISCAGDWYFPQFVGPIKGLLKIYHNKFFKRRRIHSAPSGKTKELFGPGKEVEVTQICTQLAKEVLAKEKDCLMYIPHVVKNDPTEIVFFEKYKDKEAFKAHGSSGYFQEAAQKFESLLEGKIQVKFLEEV